MNQSFEEMAKLEEILVGRKQKCLRHRSCQETVLSGSVCITVRIGKKYG